MAPVVNKAEAEVTAESDGVGVLGHKESADNDRKE